jgi:hypothetical protein
VTGGHSWSDRSQQPTTNSAISGSGKTSYICNSGKKFCQKKIVLLLPWYRGIRRTTYLKNRDTVWKKRSYKSICSAFFSQPLLFSMSNKMTKKTNNKRRHFMNLPHQVVPSPSPEIQHACQFVHGTVEYLHCQFFPQGCTWQN